MSTKLSNRMENFEESLTASLFGVIAKLKEEGKDIISLNVGEPDFPTPENIKKAGIEAIENDFTRYTQGNGILELRQAIQKKLKDDNHINYDLDEITIAVGAKQALASALMAVCGDNDEVIIPTPCYVSYPEMVKLSGAKNVFVELNPDTYQLDIDNIKKAITPNTKAIVICDPNNPTGTVYDEKSLRELADLAIQHDFYIIADEIYEKLIYGDAKHFSVASISQQAKDHTILVNGFSKTYSMTGWRLGYVAAKKDIIKTIIKIHSQTTTSPVSFVQVAAVEALTGPQDKVEEMRQAFEERMNYSLKRLRSIKGITCPDIQGAFYIFFDVSYYIGKSYKNYTIHNDIDLCQYLLEEELISTVPGSAYKQDNHIRISYSTSLELIEKAFDRLEHGLSLLK